MVVELTLQEGEYELDAPLHFDDSSAAAEVVLSAAEGAEVVLRPTARRRRLMQGGDGRPVLNITAGVLTLERVQVRGASGAPAVVVSGGELRLHQSTLADSAAGALEVLGGEVTLDDSEVTGNAVPSQTGGAITVSGGTVLVKRCTLARNTVALYVTAGLVTLANGTLLTENGASIQLDGGSVRYELPAPLGRWVLANDGVAALLPGAYESDYPYSCVPGVYGDSLAQAAQSGPGCASACPAGSYCPSGSTSPTLCPHGYYCPIGSGSYLACPAGKTTTHEGRTSASACICSAGSYGLMRGGELACEACPVGTNCVLPGATLEHLPLGKGHWRANANTTDVRLCRGTIDGSSCSGCLGENSCGVANFSGCKPGTDGPYCGLCMMANQSTSMYFDSDEMACLPCHAGDSVAPLAVTGSVVLIVFFLCVCRPLCTRLPKQFQKRMRDKTRKLSRTYRKSGARKALRGLRRLLKSTQRQLATKFKILFSFYQIVTKVGETYAVTYPPSVEKTLEVFAFTNLELDGLGLPLACLNLGSFEAKLIFLMLLPFGLMLLFGLTVGCRRCVTRYRVAVEKRRSASRDSSSGVVDLDSVADFIPDLGLLPVAFETSLLPVALRISFLAFPTVSSLAFKAFRCDDLDANDGLPGPAVMQADLAVVCWDEHGDTTDEYRRIRGIASLAIALYPVGVPLFYMLLFFKARRAIWAEKPTSLAKALDFLVGEYHSVYFFWELIEALKKLLLVGVMSVVMPGEISQLLMSVVITQIFLIALLVAKPYKQAGENVVALASGASLTIFLLFALVLKFQTLIDAVKDSLTGKLARFFSIDTGTNAALLITSSLGSLVLVAAMIVIETAAGSFQEAEHDATHTGAQEPNHGSNASMLNTPPDAGVSRRASVARSLSRFLRAISGTCTRPDFVAAEAAAPGTEQAPATGQRAGSHGSNASIVNTPGVSRRGSVLSTFLRAIGGRCTRPDFAAAEAAAPARVESGTEQAPAAGQQAGSMRPLQDELPSMQLPGPQTASQDFQSSGRASSSDAGVDSFKWGAHPCVGGAGRMRGEGQQPQADSSTVWEQDLLRAPSQLPQPSAEISRDVRDSMDAAEAELREITQEVDQGTREHPGREVRRGSLLRLNAAAMAVLTARRSGSKKSAAPSSTSDAARPVEVPGELEA